MHLEILYFLRCPVCHDELDILDASIEKGEIISGHLGCENLHKWLIREGILVFNEKEQTGMNEWSVLMKDMTPEQFDAYIENRNPKNLKELRRKVIEILSNQINQHKKLIEFRILGPVAQNTGLCLLLNF